MPPADCIDVPLTTFITEAQAGNIEIVELGDHPNLRFKLVNDSERTFKTTMEEGYTLRQTLVEAGIETQDFPPTRLTDTIVCDSQALGGSSH